MKTYADILLLCVALPLTVQASTACQVTRRHNST